MRHPVIPSGSLNNGELISPSWARPTKWLPLAVGSLARVLPLGGPTWMNELVIILEIVKGDVSTPLYRVYGRHGEAVFPYYSLDIQSHRSGSVL